MQMKTYEGTRDKPAEWNLFRQIDTLLYLAGIAWFRIMPHAIHNTNRFVIEFVGILYHELHSLLIRDNNSVEKCQCCARLRDTFIRENTTHENIQANHVRKNAVYSSYYNGNVPFPNWEIYFGLKIIAQRSRDFVTFAKPKCLDIWNARFKMFNFSIN